MLILIGSKALAYHYNVRVPQDTDVIGNYDEIVAYGKSLGNVLTCHPAGSGKKLVMKTSGGILEGEITWEGSNAQQLAQLIINDPDTMEKDNFLIPSVDILYMLKMSHRYLKNSPYFLKTMRDIHMMRGMGAKIRDEHMDFFKMREKATYTYAHPKLNVNKAAFFNGDQVNYVYEHDTIHESMKTLDKPAYSYFKPDESEVYCSREMFDALDESIKLKAVLEETQVLALERSQVLYAGVPPKKSFDMALEKVCTSITSGWFREYAWENYDKVQSLYDAQYVDKFWADVNKGIVKKLQIAA